MEKSACGYYPLAGDSGALIALERQEEDYMSSREYFAPVQKNTLFPWQKYSFDTLLAVVGVAGVTVLIGILHLYPRIPNISIVYLLVVLPLASGRGRYSAMLASVLAFLAFDFFLVPPYYTFVMYHVEEWIALFIFLLDALLTGHLASALRLRAEEASRREQETRALYQLMRITNSAEEPAGQLQAISQAIVSILSSWGVQSCAILQPDASGVMQVQASASSQFAPPSSAPDEQPFTDVVDKSPVAKRGVEGRLARLFRRSANERKDQHSRHLLPLKLGTRSIGMLQLDVLGDPRALLREEQLEAAHANPDEPSPFFWTFLDQVATLLERAHLQQENLRLAIMQRTDTLRAALLSSVSHDLRTPLTGIKAAASALLQEEVQWSEDEQRSFLQSIEREADRLNRLVANLLDMSRIEDGALKPDKDWYSLKALIQDVLGRLAPLLEGRTVVHNWPEDLLLVELDYLQIDQVLTNLLENALRYTPITSPIEIDAWREETQVCLRVADRGPGIPPVHLTRVFDKFYRVLHGPSVSSTPAGSGLGLAVCKGLVEAHGGRIWAEEREGGGLSVSVVLPIGKAERIPA
jgi:two-component system, OmpR family, sensor histidine kinase KdpD